MKIKVVSLFKTRCKHSLGLEAEYLKRCQRPMGINIIESPVKLKASQKEDEARQAYDSVLANYTNDLIILLDENGKSMDTKALSRFIEKQRLGGSTDVCFALGGPYGWSKETKQIARHTLSLSPLTMPAHLARVLLIEQLYRCYTLLHGINYHK